MKYGSVCSGIEAATVAWEPLGWEPVFFSEIEPFPRAVLAHHYPNVPCHGDFTTIKREDYAAIDVLVGGTPCQDFSLAGLRAGLDGERGNLSVEFGKLLGRLRPAWFVWENVYGVLSSNGGLDFAGILGMFTGRSIERPANGWRNAGVVQGIPSAYSVAWRVLDAQYFGVPQRRRRVFVVGCLGADYRRALAVLLECSSLSGDTPPSRKAGKETAPCFDTSSSGDDPIQVSPTLDQRTRNGPMQNQVGMAIIGHGEYSANHHPLLREAGGDCGGGSESLIVEPKAFRMVAFGEYDDDGTLSTMKERDYKDATDLNHQVGGILVESATSGGQPPDVAPTLDCSFADKWGLDNQHIDGGAGLFTHIVVKTANTKANGSNLSVEGVAYTLDTVNGQAVLAFNGQSSHHQDMPVDDISPSLDCSKVVNVLQPLVYDTGQITNPNNRSNPKAGDPCYTLSSTGHPPLLVEKPFISESMPKVIDSEMNAAHELVGTLKSSNDEIFTATIPINTQMALRGGETSNTSREGVGIGKEGDPSFTLQKSHSHAVSHGSHIRRLTPIECHRLQGFVDSHCRIPRKPKKVGTKELKKIERKANECGRTLTQELTILARRQGVTVDEYLQSGEQPDGDTYAALGNSMPTPVMRWIGERIQMVHEILMRGE